MLTFKTLQTPDVQVISGIEIPKRGCLTVAEELAVRNLGAMIDQQLQGLTPMQADLEVKQQVVSILIRSRLDRNWDIEQTKASEWVVDVNGTPQVIEPDMLMLDELYQFFMNEQHRWKPVEQIKEEAKQAEETTGQAGAKGKKK